MVRTLLRKAYEGLHELFLKLKVYYILYICVCFIKANNISCINNVNLFISNEDTTRQVYIQLH